VTYVTQPRFINSGLLLFFCFVLPFKKKRMEGEESERKTTDTAML